MVSNTSYNILLYCSRIVPPNSSRDLSPIKTTNPTPTCMLGARSCPRLLHRLHCRSSEKKPDSKVQSHGSSTRTIRTSFLPAIVSTSTRMHGEFLASSFSTGPPGDRGALQCHWNAIAATQLGLAPVSPRGLLPEFEEQSRTRGVQSGGVEDQPQY